MKPLEPQILFEDPHLIVVTKPAGLLSQGERSGDTNLVDWLRARLGRAYVGLVHRLDRNTSGVMVVAKRTKSANRLTEALQTGRLERTYLAWVHGSIPAPVRWTHFLWKDEARNLVRVVSSAHPQGKGAVLRATPLGYGTWRSFPLTLLELTLETGRSHQIRVQASQEGFPLLGDVKYGKAGIDSSAFGRPALHSFRIAFPHPMSGETLRFEAPIPPEMGAISRSATAN